MAKLLILIGIILTVLITLPFLMAVNIYRDRLDRPYADPPSKDEGNTMQ